LNSRNPGDDIVTPSSGTAARGIIEDPSIANAAISSSISPIVFVDCETENVMYVNHAFLSIWGYQSSGEVIGKNASEFWQSRRMKGQIRRRIHDRGGWIGELVAYRKDKKEFPVQVLTTMLIDTHSKPLFQMISFMDISERISAQAEQRRLLTDLQERIKELNCLYSILSIQYNNETTIEGILKRIVATIPPSLRWPKYACARIIIGDINVSTPNFRTSDSMLVLALSIGPESGLLEVGYLPNPSAGEKMELLNEEKMLLEAAAKEIERLIEQKRSEDELRRNRERLLHADKLSSIGVLSAEIMHEIGNPNNFIALNTRMLARAWKDVLPILDMYYKENGDFSVAGLSFTEAREEVARLLAGIAEGSERIRAISSHLKMFLAKKRPAMDVSFRINDAVSKAIEFSRSRIDASTGRFQVALTNVNPSVRGDSSQIQQVVINLITNACQALTSRNDWLSVSTGYDDRSNSVRVVVEDEGKGIHQRDIPHVLDPFFTTKKGPDSTGLGLSISNDIAVNHGGKLLLHSVLNHGTRIELVLPADSRNGTKRVAS
jgi:PAS domain S-box-containing protein